MHPERVERVWLGALILGGSLLLEGGATLSNSKELNERRGNKPFFRYLQDTKDSDLVVVFGENSAAVIGLALALVALVAAWLTNDGMWDGLGSLAVGVVLVCVAIFLAREVKSLLLGEAADPEISEAARLALEETPELTKILHLITVQQGPGEVMVAAKVAFAGGLAMEDVCRVIDRFEARMRARSKDIKWIFVEPDIPRAASKRPAAQEATAE
jgi:divalent metal cation (Fe/Co/Zn/Cd) transporter